MSISEMDLELKLRMMRYLWTIGYFVRRNIRVPRQNFVSHDQATDIDVFGLKIDDELDYKITICDCKSGVGIGTAGRLFWLSGLMDYFNAPLSYFVRTKMSGFEYMTLADRLGIFPLSANELTRLENAYGVDKNRFFGPFCKEQTKADNALAELSKDLHQVYAYMTSRFWEDRPHEQIASIVASCRRVKNSASVRESTKTFVLLNLTSMLCVSVLAFARNALALPSDVVEDYVREELLGGRLEVRQRREILDAFYDFMTTEVDKRYKQKYPVTKSAFLEGLTPDYSKYLVDLVLSICQDPKAFIYVPRVFDILAFETTLNGRPMNASDVVGPYSDTNMVLVIRAARDVHAFIQRAKMATDEVSKLFESEIQKLVV